jgi:hypothetical protein
MRFIAPWQNGKETQEGSLADGGNQGDFAIARGEMGDRTLMPLAAGIRTCHVMYWQRR